MSSRGFWLLVAALAIVLAVGLCADTRGAGPPIPSLATHPATAGPSPVRLLSRRARISRVVCSVFGARCRGALRVVSCETGGTFDPRAVGRAGERGLFQIHPVHFGSLDERRLFEPLYNSRFAFRLSRGGRDWSHWACRP
jgi:hypothetical protein